jgi:hypothetical protein
MKTRLLGIGVILGGLAIGQTVVVPNGNATVTGNDTSGSLIGSFPLRYQQVFDPEQFPQEPIYITGFTYRAVPGLGALNVSITGTVSVSTSATWANSTGHPLLSTTFANNIGPDNTLVYSGTATISGAACSAPGPCPWGSNVVFTAPFLYNPANGPLLIDITASSVGGPGPGQFDVIDCPNTSCVINSVAWQSTTSATGALNEGNNVTQISYTPATTFFSTQRYLSSNVYYLQLADGNPFGYYEFLQGTASTAGAWLYHFDLSYEYATAQNASGGIYLYDLTSGHWWYSSSALFPYLYDFSLSAWIYYFPNTKVAGHYTSGPRYFANLTTSAIFTM